MDAQVLTVLVAEGLTQRAIAARMVCSHSTVRHWLWVHGLTTLSTKEGRKAPSSGTCEGCGETFEYDARQKRRRFCATRCDHDFRIAQRLLEALKQKEFVSAGALKKFLMASDPTCLGCGAGCEHNGLPLVLQLDHIDGDSANNRLNNGRLLCPNCHSQTPTFGWRNRGKKIPGPTQPTPHAGSP